MALSKHDIAVRAATALKIIRLARMPDMDITAVMLNCQPTHDEVVQAINWMRAIEHASDESIQQPADIARAILRDTPRA